MNSFWGGGIIWVVDGTDISLRPEAEHIYDYERGSAASGRWVDSEDLRPGDRLRLFDGQSTPISSITTYPAKIKVYNLAVVQYHNYAVTASGVLVHNKGPQVNRVDNVITETLNGRGNFTSQLKLSADDALDAGIDFLGPNYRELGRSGSGVFRSNDAIDGYYRQFRIDNGSLSGKHKPFIDHFHLEVIDGNDLNIINNHIPYKD